MSIEDLASALADRVAAAGLVVADGRVEKVPSERTVRYYGSRGLLDPPVSHSAGRALYGERHLLQLLAIKRLQARGLSLPLIQPRLAGLSERALRAIAEGTAEEADGIDPGRPVNGATHSRSAGAARGSFWADAPAAPGAQRAPEPVALSLVAALGLGPGVALFIPADRVPETIDRHDLQRAAAPLLAYLGLGEPITTSPEPLGAERAGFTEEKNPS